MNRRGVSFVSLRSTPRFERRPLPPRMSDAEANQRSESWCANQGYRCTAPRGVSDAGGGTGRAARSASGELGLTDGGFSRTVVGVPANMDG